MSGWIPETGALFLACGATLAAIACAPVHADPIVCANPILRVEGADTDLAHRIRAIATTARPHLEACHLKMNRPVTFALRTSLGYDNPNCSGVFHRGSDLIELLPPERMWAGLAAWPVETPSPDERINELVLSFVPHRFANLAWRHFDRDGNGCALVDRILREEASFSIPTLDIE